MVAGNCWQSSRVRFPGARGATKPQTTPKDLGKQPLGSPTTQTTRTALGQQPMVSPTTQATPTALGQQPMGSPTTQAAPTALGQQPMGTTTATRTSSVQPTKSITFSRSRLLKTAGHGKSNNAETKQHHHITSWHAEILFWSAPLPNESPKETKTNIKTKRTCKPPAAFGPEQQIKQHTNTKNAKCSKASGFASNC